jgi:hypothetical protein
MNAKPTTDLTRQIRATRRALRRQKRGADATMRERCWLALKGLTEMEADPLRPMLAEYAAMNVVLVLRPAGA